jgi:hypothetical protein
MEKKMENEMEFNDIMEELGMEEDIEYINEILAKWGFSEDIETEDEEFQDEEFEDW